MAPLAGFFDRQTATPISVAAGGLGLMVEWLVPKKEADERIRPAALVYDARRFFGKK